MRLKQRVEELEKASPGIPWEVAFEFSNDMNPDEALVLFHKVLNEYEDVIKNDSNEIKKVFGRLPVQTLERIKDIFERAQREVKNE